MTSREIKDLVANATNIHDKLLSDYLVYKMSTVGLTPTRLINTLKDMVSALEQQLEIIKLDLDARPNHIFLWEQYISILMEMEDYQKQIEILEDIKQNG